MNTIALARLTRGQVAGRDVREETVRLREVGATWVHVEDVDAAQGHPAQWHHAHRFLDSGLQVSWGGGVRSLTQIQQLLDLGAARVTVGRHALANPLWFREAGHIFGKRVGLDASGDADDLAKARLLHDAGHGCTVVADEAPPSFAREAGTAVWVKAGGAHSATGWDAEAVLLETDALEDPAILQRWPAPPGPARRIRPRHLAAGPGMDPSDSGLGIGATGASTEEE